ncbi:SDR family NAD(P)-dependent oxidoreductase [Desulfosporosinus sp. FKB]|uniref:SDR family NAD(P)-dependent oxidoreductase n=1 Tax=Desulfosporosinus sp. FKB TaxID=1969835 RepID=UPI001A9A3857|nr:SDR family NAD(P)-dependent oxidoreductase [Desulfosporosinus sp. FKB]
MDLNLESKVVLVTGGSKGIGLACARAFLAEGARVAIASRSSENLDAAQVVVFPFILAKSICQKQVKQNLWRIR